MKLYATLANSKPSSVALPKFIRELRDIRGVRVLRLQGSVGMEIGREVEAADKSAAKDGAFTRHLLLDFAGTTGWDFSTVAYLVLALRRRVRAQARVGIINAPARLIAEFEIARVGAWFRLFDSEQQALAELADIGSVKKSTHEPPGPPYS